MVTSKIRSLDKDFEKAFSKGGLLLPILEQVQKDKTLMFCIRDDYINIYYRGGNIMRIEKKNSNFTALFNPGYFNHTSLDDELKRYNIVDYDKKGNEYAIRLFNEKAVADYINLLPCLKNTMDIHFSSEEKDERIYQQIVCLENNRSRISNPTAYFITDIEYTIPNTKAKVDMVAIKWPKSNRKKYTTDKDNGKQYKTVQLAFIEMKYGIGALVNNKSGLEKHLKDMTKIAKNSNYLEDICRSTEYQLNILNKFDLIEHTNKNYEFKVECNDEKPEYIILLANVDPDSEQITKALEICKEYADDDKNDYFKLRFFIANTAGYGFFEDCVVTYDEFMKRVKANK